MKLISPSEELFIKEMSQAKLPLSALDAATSSKEELFSIGLGISNCKSEVKTESYMSPQCQFSSTNSLLPPVQNSVGSKPRKRTRSKSGLKNRKKGKRGTSSNSADDEALDTDIFAFVETLDTNKNLDSDSSSTNTIILDDLNNQISSSNVKDVESKLCVNLTEKRTNTNSGEILFSDVNFQERNDNHLPITTSSPYNTFSILPQSNNGNSLPLNCNEICTNFYNSSKGRVLISSEKSSVSESQYSPLIKHSNIEGVSRSSVHSKPSVPLLSKVSDISDKFRFNRGKGQDGNNLFLGTSSINSVLISPSNPIPNCNNYIVNPFAQRCLVNVPKENAAKILSGAQVSEVKEQLPKSSVSSTSLLVPNVCQSDQKLNSQSVYASMGLDEDLCDVDIQNPKREESSKRSTKDPHSSLFPKEINSVQLLNKIKSEKSQLFTPTCTTKNNSLAFDSKSEIFSPNDLYVSMTFEAEPSVDEDEDDLPLSELKNQMSAIDTISKLKKKSEKWSNFITDNVSGIHPSLFIKKELIEDEIVSESEAVSSQNLLSVSAASSSNTEVKTSVSSAYNDFTAVKIKAEPKDDFPGTEPIDSFPVSLNYNPTQVTSHNTGLIPEVSPVVKHTSVELNDNTCQSINTIGNAAPSPFVLKPQSEDKLNANSSLPPVSDVASKESNLAGNISDTSVTITKKSKTNRKRKLSNKNTKIVSKNVKTSSSFDIEPHKSLLKEALQGVNICEGNSDLNSSLSVTDTDTESNSSKKRGKKKKKTESIDDVPISLLIKAQKPNESDKNPSNSFLCSSKSKSSIGEAKPLSALSASDKVLIDSQEKSREENTSNDIDSLYLQSPNLIVQQKNKRQNKKKQPRKPKGKNKFSPNISSELMQYENQSLNPLNVPLKPDDKLCSGNAQLNPTKSEISKFTLNLESSKYSDSEKAQSTAEQKVEPYVYMTFEEQSPTEENFEDILKPVSSIKREKDRSPPRESLKKTLNISPDILSVVKNIKQEKGDFLHPESQVTEVSNVTPPDYNPVPTHLSQVDDTQSIVSSVASNSNIDDESSMSTVSNFDSSVDLNLKVQSKKKKRRPRSNGWYKKKKSKSKAKLQSFPSVEIKECSNHSEMAAVKVPVVIIKNLLPRDGIVKINNSGSLEHETAELPAKGKKKKKATSSKKKKAAKQKQNFTNNEVAQKDVELEGHKDAEVPNCSLQSESVKLLEKGDSGNENDISPSIFAPVSDHCSEIPVTPSENPCISDHLNPAKKPRSTNDCDVHSSFTNSSAEVPRYTSFPSLDVNKISQEIEELILLKNQGESSDRSRQNSLDCDSREELNIPPKVSKPNILETFNMSPKSMKSKNFNSFEALTNVQIKKEPDYDPKGTFYCPREDSLLSSNENDKTDNSCKVAEISDKNHCLLGNKELSLKDSECNVSSSDLSQIKKEKEVRTNITDKSEISTTSSKISDKPVWENPSDKITDSVSKTNTNPALQSESLKNISQSPVSVDIDKLALSIKKEVYDAAKLKSSNFSIKDQNDLIEKACTSQPGKLIAASSVLPGSTTTTKSVCPFKSQSDSVQIYNLEGEDDEIQILQEIANHKNPRDVPIVDLTEENNINDPVTEIQGVSLQCKDESTKILPMHINTAKVSDFSYSLTQKNVQECNARQVNADHINAIQGKAIQGNAVQSSPTQINSKTVCDQLYGLENIIKTKNSNVINSLVSAPVSDLRLKQKSLLEEDKQVIIDNKKNKASLEELRKNSNEESLESVTKEKEDFVVEIEMSNSSICKDKYFEEYFKHPFPPSLVLHNTKQRNRNKQYTRINSKAWNLSIEEVEARLKLSENIIPQIDGDAVKLEEYPVSVNEVECYHRILGVAPSQKLLFKCFKSPEKKVNTFINNGFNSFPTFPHANMNSIESEKQFHKGTCSLEDILKGITETKMMYSNNNVGHAFSGTGKDCISTESRDSSDSFISNMSGVQSRDLKTVDLNAIGNEFIHNENSNSRSSALSCRLPTLSEGDITNVNFKAPKTAADQFVSSVNSNENINLLPSQSTLNCFSLPTQDTVNSIVNTCNPSSSCVGNYSELRSNIANSIEAQSSCHSFNAVTEYKSNDESKFQTEKKQVFDIDVPVTELLKILKTAESLRSDSVNLDNRLEDRSLWTSQATYEYNHTRSQKTYEYNHTRSVPVVEKSSEFNNLNVCVLPSEIASCSNFVSQSTPLQEETSSRQVATESVTVSSKPTLNACTSNVKEDAESEQGSFAKKSVQEDSDSDCVDNEPICNDDYDRENDESSSHAEEQTAEERPVPQYKSKWEKIMERKSLENKEKEIINEHLLKDCFPVKSTRTRNMVSHKNVSKTNEKTEKSSKSTFSGKKQNKDDKIDKCVKQKQNDLNCNVEKQNDKSSKSNKIMEEKKTKTISEKETKNKAAVEKNKAAVEKNKTKNVSEKNKISIPEKNKLSDNDSSNLFVPDKPLKISKGLKQDVIHQSNENSKSKRFYGNRVTNRGTFLTESSSSTELLKKIKIPKKKKFEIPKKNFNVRSEEFHSMVKSPDINIEPAFHPYKTFNKSFDSRKNSEYYRSPLESTSPSSSSHFIRTKHARGRRMYHSDFHPQERQRYPKMNYDPRSKQSKSLHDEIMGRKTLLSTPPNEIVGRKTLLSTPPNEIVGRKTLLSTPPNISPVLNDENSMNRKPSLLSSPSIPFLEDDESTGFRKTSQFNLLPSLSSHQSNDGSIMGRNNSHLGPLTSISSRPCNDESLLYKNIPNLTSSSITPNLPVESFQPVVNSSNMNLLNSILSALTKSNQISTVPEKDSEPPFSDNTNPSWDNSLAYNFKESRQSMNVQVNMPGDPATSLNKSYGNIHPQDYFNNSKPASTHPLPTAPPKNPFDSILDTPGPVNSPPYTSSVNSSTHIPAQPSRKAICLVPKHLKTLVGHKTIETHNVRLLMLEWSVDWLVQQQQFHDPPPISNALKKVVSTYDSFEDYYNTYFPLMLLDTWHRIYVSWTHLNQANPYSCQITSYSVKSQYVSVECQTVFNTAAHPKGVFPDEGSILMVKYTTKSNEYTIKILGYVTNVKTRRFNNVTDSKLFSSLRMYKDVNPDVLQILSLTFMGAYNSEDIDKRQPIRIHVLCNVKPTLKQNDAMLFINNSPLHRSILNPVADGLLSFTLTPRNSPLEKTNECVRDITKGILTPHPLPLLTVVRAKPESDRLNIIPLLIEKMKCAYKTKVLLCVRTVRALGDIAANICLHQSLKLVIINKRCDTNPQFQKFLLDDLAAAELSKNSEDKANEKHHAKNDTIVKLKKQVLKECDVVLSLVRNCHDEFIGETFTETDCISQMCCIVDEANLCTEPETLIPILHGISKLILIGDSDYPAKVLSKTASAYDYSQSFFQRAYDLDLITE